MQKEDRENGGCHKGGCPTDCMADRGREKINRRLEYCFEKYGWTPEQRARFQAFVEERFANYSKPYNTVSGYITVLNQVVESVKKPFSDMDMDDLLPILQKWQGMSSASAHGWICKLKAFLRWESGNKNDPRAGRNIISMVLILYDAVIEIYV